MIVAIRLTPREIAVGPALHPYAPSSGKLGEVEIEDAELIFASVWKRLATELGAANLRFPKEIILLGGAPGAGKGTHTAFISRVRDLTCLPVVIKELRAKSAKSC